MHGKPGSWLDKFLALAFADNSFLVKGSSHYLRPKSLISLSALLALSLGSI